MNIYYHPTEVGVVEQPWHRSIIKIYNLLDILAAMVAQTQRRGCVSIHDQASFSDRYHGRRRPRVKYHGSMARSTRCSRNTEEARPWTIARLREG